MDKFAPPTMTPQLLNILQALQFGVQSSPSPTPAPSMFTGGVNLPGGVNLSGSYQAPVSRGMPPDFSAMLKLNRSF